MCFISGDKIGKFIKKAVTNFVTALEAVYILVLIKNNANG